MTLIQKMQALAGGAVVISSATAFLSYSTRVLDLKKKEEEYTTSTQTTNSSTQPNYGGWTFSDWATDKGESSSSWF